MFIKIKTDDAIMHAGSKSMLANLLGITRQSLTSWGDYLPQTSAQKLYILTDGRVGTKANDENQEEIKPNQILTQRNSNMFYP